ncbi:MAG: DUF362 domain-containing protein [Planctomycetota bacterium]|nr:DUF362 domain-containing protein [Planctomycetota bacterium]MDI6787688.1 DUF362 domain-containing protein [Planctomycetota bacterium]
MVYTLLYRPEIIGTHCGSQEMKDNLVYFTATENNESPKSVCLKLKSLFKKTGFGKIIKKGDFVAIKMHMGEEKKKPTISPLFVRVIVDLVKESGGRPFVTDTNVLYESVRENAVDHLGLAEKNGFSYQLLGCPVIIADGLVGENQLTIKTENGYVSIAGLVKRLDVIIALTHCTGHLLTGYGGAIKNIAMGLSSRGGKLDQHSDVKPEVITQDCQGCRICETYCPADAIETRPVRSPSSKGDGSPAKAGLTSNGVKDKKAFIITAKCYGCGECFAVCPHNAIKVDKWHSASDSIQKKMALYCREILRDKRSYFINFAMNITKNCDCIGEGGGAEKPLIDDIGILMSLDPVAVDTASIDLINKKAGKDIFKTAWQEIDYTIQLMETERLGVGTRRYDLVH